MSKKKTNTFFIFILLYASFFCVELSFSNSYFISFENGNDQNDGKTPSSPWKYCPGIPGWTGDVTLNPGDTVFFNNSEVWEGSNAFSLLQVKGGVKYDGQTWGTGIRAIFRAEGDLQGSIINITDDHALHPTVIIGFEIDANNNVASGIGVNWPRSQKSLDNSVKRIENCVVKNVASLSTLNQYEYGILVSSGYGGERIVSNIEILFCRVFNISRGGINIYPSNDEPKSFISNVAIRGNEVYDCGTDPTYQGGTVVFKNHCKNIIFEYNTVYDGDRGISIGSDNSSFFSLEEGIIRYNIIKRFKSAGVSFSGYLNNGSIDVFGNLIFNNDSYGVHFNTYDGSYFSVNIYNNTFFLNNSSGLVTYCKTSKISSFEIINNIFFAGTSSYCITDGNGNITRNSNNIYYKSEDGSLILHNQKTYDSNTIISWEPTAKVTNPIFIDTSNLPTGFISTELGIQPNFNGLSVSEASPARNNGLILDKKYSISINSCERLINLGWDIGAYEYCSNHKTNSYIIKKIYESAHHNINSKSLVLNKFRTLKHRIIVNKNNKISFYLLTGRRVSCKLLRSVEKN